MALLAIGIVSLSLPQAQLAAIAEESALVIEHCGLFDPHTGQMLPDRTIVVRSDKIIAVAGPDEAVEVPAEAVRIDGRGKYALPGMIDAHTHMVHVLDYARVTGDEVLPLYLAAGVTSVRSTGEEILEDIRHTRRIELVVRGGLVTRPAEVLQRAAKE